jgi:hypothetical protein
MSSHNTEFHTSVYNRWFKYDRDLYRLFTHKSVPIIFEPPCTVHATQHRVGNIYRYTHVYTYI